MLVSSPTASATSSLTVSTVFPNMFETTLRMLFSSKVTHKVPLAAPVKPMMPETSPQAERSFFKNGFPATAFVEAMVSNTFRVAVINGLINLTSIAV